jgi:RNA polymerase sigma-70 factor (ECF subfamily)
VVVISDPTPADEFDTEFEAFFLEHHDDTLRSLHALLNDREAAVDATQDAFIKAHARWSVIRTYDAPQAWVRRIAINASRDRLRSERRRRDRETLVDPVDEPPASDPIVADAGIQALLDGLPARQREIAALFYVNDCSVDEIARRLTLSVGTVKSQLSEARDRLRRSHLS